MEQRARASSRDGAIDGSEAHGRFRRPTGAPPPLPKKIGATGVFRLALVVLVVIPGCIWLHYNPAPLDRFDAAITDAVVSLRVGWLDTLARSVNAVASRYGLALLGLLTVVGVAWFRRWRHLTLLLIGAAVVGVSVEGLLLLAARPRPRSVRRDPERGQPVAAAGLDEGGRRALLETFRGSRRPASPSRSSGGASAACC